MGLVHTKSESSLSSSSSEDREIVVVDEVPKQPTPSDKTVTEKINGIFKRDRSTSSSSSDTDDGKKHEIPLPVEKEVVHTTSSSSSSSSDSEDDVEKVIEVEEVTKQETPSETPIIEKITGIFKRD